jgi:transcriptional regulator with XRE-family HTH domain
MEDTMSQDTTGNNTESQRPADISDGIFARQLFKLRKTAGLTQEQLAERMAAAGNAMHRSAIAKIESGDRSVPVGEAIQFAEVLGVDLGALTTEDTVRDRALHEGAEVQIRVRNLQHLAAERHRGLEEAQFLYGQAAEQLEQAQRELSSWDRRLKAAEQQLQPGTSAWVAPESEDDQ